MKTKLCIKAAMEKLGLSKLRKHQSKPINALLDHRDVLLISPTGSGKSAIFQIPALVMHQKHSTWTLVIEPTLSLMEDQVHTLQKKGISAEYLSSRNEGDHKAILNRLSQHQIALLYVTPERLQSFTFQQSVHYNSPWLVVVDEAHCILDWGSTFRHSYQKIKSFTKTLKRRPTIAALTATAPAEYRLRICNSLQMENPICFSHSLARSNIVLMQEDCSNLKLNSRLSRVSYHIKKYRNNGRVVVYCASRKNVDLVSNYLSKKFPNEVVKCHGYMDPSKREQHELQFISGDKPIMVSSTAFGMGIDAKDIRLVVHFNLPLNAIDYYQQIGRAGRDNEKSHAVLLYHPDDIKLNRYILNQKQYSEQLRTWLNKRFDELVSILTSRKCLWEQLLQALGEDDAQSCGRCTNCQRKRRSYHENSKD